MDDEMDTGRLGQTGSDRRAKIAAKYRQGSWGQQGKSHIAWLSHFHVESESKDAFQLCTVIPAQAGTQHHVIPAQAGTQHHVIPAQAGTQHHRCTFGEVPIKAFEFQPIIVTTTSDDRDILEMISRQLVAKNIAACVQISGPISSCYRWQTKIEVSQEWTCAIKTSRARFAELEAVILKLHNYDQPQLVAVDISIGNTGYLDWMRSEIRT